MKKMIVPVVIGLAVGLGGSTAAVMLMGKEPESLEQSLEEAIGHEAADSAAHGDSAAVAHADTAAHGPSDSLAVAVAETTHVTGHPAAAAPAGRPSVPGIIGGTAASLTSGPPAEGINSAELAKLFASMQAREAARVLEHMDDYEVQVILGALGNREAAAILSNLTPERAAVISRSVIRGERSSR